jgi:fumarylacetoacetase
MNNLLNETHDPARRSWVESANTWETDFPIQNLPFGVFEIGNARGCGVAIGDFILDVAGCAREGLFSGTAAEAAAACSASALNSLLSLSAEQRSALRLELSRLLERGSPHAGAAGKHLVPMRQARLLLPAAVGDYTDFYASVHHATRVGALFRPDNPLLPNYKYVPIAYHGRSSSIVVSGTSVRRPNGQTQSGEAPPGFGPSRRLDYELEIGFFAGPGNRLGEPVPIAEAGSRIAGVCLVNDWSARDIQRWEYQPLGPFLSKNFATTISPWVITMEALAPFRCPASPRPSTDPPPLPYLDHPGDRQSGGIDISLEVKLSSERMRSAGIAPMSMSRGSFRDMYWTPAQMLAHHTSNGCNLSPGDLIASGTVSGPEPDSGGCLLELTGGGRSAITLPTGEERRFLEDGDQVWLVGRCHRKGYASIGFGECSGIVVPALPI